LLGAPAFGAPTLGAPALGTSARGAPALGALGARLDACSAISSCSGCAATSGCSWCLGRLSVGGVVQPGQGHCFGGSQEHTCSGLTLTASCSVYKCPWYRYYNSSTPDCVGLNSTCSATTTADDADFRRDFPASAYLTSGACSESCVDPTVGCVGGTCSKTGACDPTSSCSACEAVQLPQVLQGLQISDGYVAGIWTFSFTLSTDKKAYKAVTVTDPSGVASNYEVRGWTGTTAVLAVGASEFGALFAGIDSTGALGKNVYVALGSDAAIPRFGDVMHAAGASEFALLACEFDSDGNTVSGQNTPINCAVGKL